MCCLVIFGFFSFSSSVLWHIHTLFLPTTAGEASSTLLFQGHACSQNTHTHSPRSANCTVLSTCHSKVPPARFPHESSLTEGQLGGWDHTRGEGAQEVEQGFRYINPRATVVTHSLTQNHHGPRQSLTHTATSQLVMKKNICCKEGSSFPTNGKAVQDNTVKSTVN